MSEAETLRLVYRIEGWLAILEGLWLYRAAIKVKKGCIVEIGSWKGKSTVWLARGSQSGTKATVYAIDPHTGSEEHKEKGTVWTYDTFLKNITMAGVKDIVVPIVKTSEEAVKGWDKPIELLFIDGSHEYEDVKLDFELWSPHLVKGGLIAFHDSVQGAGWKDPIKLVQERIYNNKDFTDVREICTITFAKKI